MLRIKYNINEFKENLSVNFKNIIKEKKKCVMSQILFNSVSGLGGQIKSTNNFFFKLLLGLFYQILKQFSLNNNLLNLRNKQNELESLEKQGESTILELKRNNQLISEEQVKVGQLIRDSEKNKERIENRNSAMLSLSEDLLVCTCFYLDNL